MAASVSSAYARGLVEFAVRKQAGRGTLMEAAGLAPTAIDDPDARLPLEAYARLMRAAQAQTGDRALALHFGEAVDIAEVSIVGLIGQASATMAEAFAQLNRYVRLVVEVDVGEAASRFSSVRDRHGEWIVDNRRNPEAFPELGESAFAQLVCAPRRFNPDHAVRAAHFTHADPGYRAEYERIFRAPVVFGAERNALLLDPAVQARPVQRLPRYAFGLLTARADELLHELDSSKSIRAKVEGLIAASLHTGGINMDLISGRLAVSRKTLLRRLKAEGVTFEQVLEDLRRRLALEYLEARKVSVNETAYLIGFSDPAAFSKAFKRWTGASPTAWREAQAA